MHEQTWLFINSFAPWLSAIGTLSAVAISLWLTLRDRNVRLEITCGIRRIAAMADHPDLRKDYISITITNIGRRPANVTSVYWVSGIFRKRYVYQIPDINRYTTKLPGILKDGEQAVLTLEADKFVENLDKLFEHFNWSCWPKFKARTLSVGAFTTARRRLFTSRVEAPLAEWMFQQYEKRTKSGT